MNAEFVQEIVEHERMPHRALLTGWETIVFQIEDEPEPAAADRKAGKDVGM
jgi:hypothetical protein